MLILNDVELKKYTTINIGGKISSMFFPVSTGEIIEAILDCKAKNVPFLFVAGGSNIVFEDKDLKYNQVVINLSKFNQFSSNLANDKLNITAQAGVKLQDLVDLSFQNKCGNMVGLNRVPGTIGGAIIGNAGAYGTEIKDILVSVKAICLSEINSTNPTIHTFSNANCCFEYRHSFFKNNLDYLVIESVLECNLSSEYESDILKYKEIATKRDEIYPIGFRSPGSLFKNILFSELTSEQKAKIPKDWVVHGNKLPVGKLLEELGLKGKTIGGIKMTDRHPNIMHNWNNASFEDASNMVKFLQEKVKSNFGIDIVPEVRFLPKDFGNFR
jgi:UDP-N-acetylmuramate dehydrogenase